MSCEVEDEPPLPPWDVDRQTAGPGYIPHALSFDSQHNHRLPARGILNHNTPRPQLHMDIPVGYRTNTPVTSPLLKVHHWRWNGPKTAAKTTSPARKLSNALPRDMSTIQPPSSAEMRFILYPRSCECKRDPPQ
jgi:hypothetical protein